MTQPSDLALSDDGGPPRLPPDEARRVAALVGGHPIMGTLPLDALADLVAGGALAAFAPGEFLLRRGETSDFALLLVEGTAHVFIDTPYGDVHLADVHGPAVVGEVAAFTGVPRTAHVQAMNTIRAVRIGAQALKEAGRAHPPFLEAALRQIGGRLETFNRAVGFYSSALNALERHDFDMRLLDDLRNPLPELANFAASFRRLAEEIMVRQALRREMESATAIQRAMLPEPMEPADLGHRGEIQACMRPAKEVGGDFYDMFPLPDGRLVMSVGDVSGKGVPAALFMSATQTALRYVLRRESDLATAIGIVNELLCATNSESMFVTLFSAVLNLDDGTLDYCNCGHLDVMVLRRDGTTDILPPVGMAVGILDRARFGAQRVTLAPGDRLFLFTDGLPDAADPADNPFGEDRLREVTEAAREKAGTAFVDHILDAVERFAQGAAQFDDITLLVLTYGGPNAAR